MRIAYLDCFSGISGDMFLGAAVDAGVPLDQLQSVAESLGLDTSLTSRRVERNGIAATKVDVLVHGRPDQPIFEPEHHGQTEHQHDHEAHGHSHAHAQASQAPHSHDHTHRGLPEIREIISRAHISEVAKTFALRAFELLSAAEGKVHNRPPESIHFHEVGSEDAIVDIVCAAVAVESLAIDHWYCSALNVGSGTVRCAHGVLPVPAPATAELLRGAPIYSAGPPKELLTPTGAAILRALEVRFEPLPGLSLLATGYGAGGRDLPGTANVVRLLVGESQDAADLASPNSGDIIVLEANIDDMNPQLFSYVQQKLLDLGALDAFAVPIQMKKGRPGMIFTVLAMPAKAESLSRVLLTETTTLGVRMRTEKRRILARRHVTVQSPWGPIRVKLGVLEQDVVNVAPEFEDCRAIAEAHNVPLKTVLQEAVSLYLASAQRSAADTSKNS